MKINYQSDFKLLEVGGLCDTTTPFRYEYRTSRFATYVAQFDGETYTNCSRVDDNSLLVIFDSHSLDVGELEVRRQYFITDTDFADKVNNSISFERTGVTLTDGPSDTTQPSVTLLPAYITIDSGSGSNSNSGYSDSQIDSLLATKLSTSDIVQEIGDSTTKVMSQAAATASFMLKDDEDLESLLAYGIQFNTAVSSPSCTRIGNTALHASLPIQSLMRGCLLADDGTVNSYLPDDSWTSSVRDGSAGQVMVEIPAHYRKFVTDGTTRQVWLSTSALSGYDYVEKSYISAYEAALNRTTLKLSSVVNTTDSYRGGNNTSSWDDTYRDLRGCAVSNISLAQARTYARNRDTSTTEWNCAVYEQYKSLYWLFTVEYATLNSQAAYNSSLSSEGYKQGGLGTGTSNVTSSAWTTYNSQNPFVACGATDSMGNGTGILDVVVANSDYSVYYMTSTCRYRGIENPFGHLGQLTDGIKVDVRNTTDGGVSMVYTAAYPANYSDSSYAGYELIGYESRSSSVYTNQIIFGTSGDIVSSATGGSSSTYHCDGHYTSTSTTAVRVAVFGGATFHDSYAGFTCLSSELTTSEVATYNGTRLSFIPNNN
ncbi:MAG: hypothetical protein SNG49_05735 [Rikenellaceae bacterium]